MKIIKNNKSLFHKIFRAVRGDTNSNIKKENSNNKASEPNKNDQERNQYGFPCGFGLPRK